MWSRSEGVVRGVVVAVAVVVMLDWEEDGVLLLLLSMVRRANCFWRPSRSPAEVQKAR